MTNFFFLAPRVLSGPTCEAIHCNSSPVPDNSPSPCAPPLYLQGEQWHLCVDINIAAIDVVPCVSMVFSSFPFTDIFSFSLSFVPVARDGDIAMVEADDPDAAAREHQHTCMPIHENAKTWQCRHKTTPTHKDNLTHKGKHQLSRIMILCADSQGQRWREPCRRWIDPDPR